jgi:F-type H+-transporting ATPase subunit b
VEGHAAHAPSITELIYPVINFTIFAWVVVRALRGPVREFFRARGERIRTALATGDRARQDAEALRAQLARDLADLPGLRARLAADLRATAEREREQILTQARATATRIRADATLLAEQELATARRRLRTEIVDEAVHEAIGLLGRAMQPQDHDRFVRTFIETARPAS